MSLITSNEQLFLAYFTDLIWNPPLPLVHTPSLHVPTVSRMWFRFAMLLNSYSLSTLIYSHLSVHKWEICDLFNQTLPWNYKNKWTLPLNPSIGCADYIVTDMKSGKKYCGPKGIRHLLTLMWSEFNLNIFIVYERLTTIIIWASKKQFLKMKM